MATLYIAVLAISSGSIAIEKIANEEVNPVTINKYDGFEFRVLYYDQEFFQLKVYAANLYTTRSLIASVDNSGTIVGGKYGVPILLETDGGFAGVLCSYVFMVQERSIQWEELYQSIGIYDIREFSVGDYRGFAERMKQIQRVNGFSELMHNCETDPILSEQTGKMIAATKVFAENFYSNLRPEKRGIVQFQENLSLLAARETVEAGKHTAVLNFANPLEPGGGVLRGATAQEENLCRSSNLYKGLVSENAISYYQANKSILSKNYFDKMFLGNDMVVYSPKVTVLKEDIGYQKGFSYNGCEEYASQTFDVDIITCAAPFFSATEYALPNGDLQRLMEKRIQNIFEVAIDNEVEALILGAFGCGAFNNPPNVVAEAFRKVLLQDRYRNAYDTVVFAVKRTDVICPNIEAFERNFSLFPDLNDSCSEKQHRLSWKWECKCGLKHMWDDLQCNNCHTPRKNGVKVTLYHKR